MRPIYLYIAVAILIALYLFPWVVNPGASLSLNAYDLAEWTSLHPAARNAVIPLLPSLLLRLPLACIALLVAFGTKRSVFSVVIVVLITVALLPPPEFIHALDDPNYRQQAALAAFVLIGGVLGLRGTFPRQRRWIAAVIAFVGAASCLVGVIQGYRLMLSFDLPTQIGLGGIAMALVFLVVGIILVIEELRQRRVVTTRRMMSAVNGTG